MTRAHLVRDINIGANSSSPRNLISYNGLLFFVADDGKNGYELWSSNGTAAGTRLVKDVLPGSSTNYWGDVEPNSSFPSDLTVAGRNLFFSTDRQVFNSALWVSNGTTAGTRQIAGIRAKVDNLSGFAVLKGVLYFIGDDGTWELWRSDGTGSGTKKVTQINHISSVGSAPRFLTAAGRFLYFSADHNDTGRELWVSNGTAAGTKLVKDIAPGMNFYPWSSEPEDITGAGNRVFFTADDRVTGRELWVSNGTAAGTKLVMDIKPGGSLPYLNSSNPGHLTPFGGRLFFTADNGRNGTELWITDGSEAGTQMVKDIRPGPNGSGPTNLTVMGSHLYFTANDGVRGTELWKSDGTAAGTVLVKDILSVNSGEGPRWLTPFNGLLYFSAQSFVDGALTGHEPWVTDGTSAGTRMIANIQSDANVFPYQGSEPAPFKAVGNQLFFVATDNARGRELWQVDVPRIGRSGPETIRGTALPEFLDGRGGLDTLIGGKGPDTFGFRFGESSISAPDRIMDFRFGEDRIMILNRLGQSLQKPSSLSRAGNNSKESTRQDLARSVFRDADGRKPGNQPLRANQAAIVQSTNKAIAGTYLIINDSKAAQSNLADLMINITGYGGVLPSPGDANVNLLFG
jgi:ELWxxDGT repeat protein